MNPSPLHKYCSGWKRNDTILLAASAAVICIVLLKMLHPFFTEWNKQTGMIQEKKRILGEYQRLLGQEDSLRESFETLSRQIQTEIPAEREESQFLTEIGKVAADTNVHISTMNPQPYKDFGPFKELSVEIQMEANLGNLARFLYNIKKSSVVLVADNLYLQPKSERSALLKGQLVISTIFVKDE